MFTLLVFPADTAEYVPFSRQQLWSDEVDGEKCYFFLI
jgi:hypothetical protein